MTPWYFPHKVLPWEAAVTLVYRGKVDVVVEYDDEVRSPSVSMRVPAVLRLRRTIGAMKHGVRFSRTNVFTRDKFRCQYCGHKFLYDELTYDHVVPKKHGGAREWDNIVTACMPCNNRKGSRSCDEARMYPINAPIRPNEMAATGPVIRGREIPEEWQGFCSGIIEVK